MTLRQRLGALAERQGGAAVLASLVLVLALALVLRANAALNPSGDPLPDSITYERLADDLYERGAYGDPGLRNANDYSPGTPLLLAGLYYLTGGVHPLLGRLLMALLSAAAVMLSYLIARRLVPANMRWPPVVAAALVAIYPVFRSFAGMTMSEPLAAFTLSGAVLATLWAADRGSARAWALPAVTLGLTALVRPDYLPLGAALVLLAGLRLGRSQGRRQGFAAAAIALVAFAAPIIPWTARSIASEHRFVPISTGGGKALFIGTYLPAYDGDLEASRLNERLRARLFAANPGLRAAFHRRYPDLAVLGSTGEELATLARRVHPRTPVDRALGGMALHNLRHYVSSDPLRVLSAAARKAWETWSEGVYTYYHATMKHRGWAAIHLAIVVAAVIGLAGLAWRRRWEFLPLTGLVIWVTLLAALLIPSPRRVLVLIPVLCALAASGASWLNRPRRPPPASPRAG